MQAVGPGIFPEANAASLLSIRILRQDRRHSSARTMPIRSCTEFSREGFEQDSQVREVFERGGYGWRGCEGGYVFTIYDPDGVMGRGYEIRCQDL